MEKIALCMIVKDDSVADELRNALDSVKEHVDGIFLTGNNEPQEEIKKVAKEYGANYSFLKWRQDFSEQRNFNFQQAFDAGFRYILWIDHDDTVKGAENLRALADKMPSGIDALVTMYDYGKEAGYTNLEHKRERLIRWDPSRMRWVGRLHEQIIAGPPLTWTDTTDFTIDHKGKTLEEGIEAAKRNLAILLIEREDQGENPDPRTLIQLGRTLVGIGEFRRAIPYLEEYIPLSGWDEERYEAIYMLGYCAESMGNTDAAEKFYYRAMMEMNNRYLAYEGLIRLYVARRQWDKVIFWFEVLSRVPKPETNHMVNPMGVELLSRGFYAFALMFTGRVNEAWSIWRQIQAKYPEHPYVIENNTLMERAYHEGLTLDAITKIVAYAQRYDARKLPDIYESLPRDFQHHPTVAQLKQQTLKPRTHSDKEVTIYCGPIGLEEWAYPSIIKGIGGSEEAVINVAKELTELGYKVTVYNMCGKLSGEYNGVTYLPYFELNPSDKFNIFVSWRDGSPFMTVEAKVKWLWLHDVPMPEQFPKDLVEKIDKIIVLSKYHRSLLPDIPDEKFLISRNGVDLTNFNKEIERNPLRVIYTSSPERGLDYLLKVLPAVRSQVPDVVFEAYYGWQNNDAARGGDPAYQEWKAEVNQKMKEFGMPEYTRLNHRQIAEKMLSSGVWFYPTDFPEISCIAAMKAQVSGAIPVCFNFAALNETIQFGQKLDGDPKNEKDLKKITTVLIEQLKSQDEKERQKMMAWAREAFPWRGVAESWAEEWQK